MVMVALRAHVEVVLQLPPAHDVLALRALDPVALGRLVLVGSGGDDAR